MSQKGRGKIVKSRREREFENNFSYFERRKRNLKVESEDISELIFIRNGTKSWISRGEKDLSNLGNREEKEKLFYKILKIKRKREIVL